MFLKDYIPVYSATVVDRLESAGAISLGKLNHDAWAMGKWRNSDFGATRNPWNTEYVPGGSYIRIKCLCAAVLFLSHSNEHGGSTRQPASFTKHS